MPEFRGQGPNSGEPIQVELTDTGGYGAYTRHDSKFDDAGADLSSLTRDIEGQIAKAVANADLVLFVVDTQAGITPMDETVARLLRQGGLGPAGESQDSAAGKVVILANKADGPKWENFAYEAAGLGFGEPLIASAKNNYRRRDLVERLFVLAAGVLKAARQRKDPRIKDEGPEGSPEMKLAIVGKRNAGKSTLVNTLAGEDRVIVSEIAGTTRDAIDVRFTIEGRSLLAIDTAGLRRKKSFDQRIEWWALDRMEQAIDRSDVALFMIDATEPLSHVDHQVGMMLADRSKPCIIVVNKWDLAQGQAAVGQQGARGKPVSPEIYEAYIRKELKGLWYAPISFISAKVNDNVRETINLAFELQQQSGARMGTGALNRLVRSIVERQGPPSRDGSFAKVFYSAQIGVHPPTIALVVNKPNLFTQTYERFLLNRLRDASPFNEVPIKLVIKGRSKRATSDDAALVKNFMEQAEAISGRGDDRSPTKRRKDDQAAMAEALAYFDEPADAGAVSPDDVTSDAALAEAMLPETGPTRNRAKAPTRTDVQPNDDAPAKPSRRQAAAMKGRVKAASPAAKRAAAKRAKEDRVATALDRRAAKAAKARPKAAEAKARSKSRSVADKGTRRKGGRRGN
jgi:GTP-binding protein